jgi:sortase A
MQHRPRRQNRRISIIGVLGELLITAGVVVFLFLGWQLWLNDIVVGAEQNKAGAALAHSFEVAAPTPTATPSASAPAVAPDYGEPIVVGAPAIDTKFGVMYIPRFGPTYMRSITQGVGVPDVLNKNGIGHYPGTQMPGQVGNFAVAAHRTTYGAPFKQVATLQVGDNIYIQTQEGYYTYQYRGLEYVRPTGVGVLAPVPQLPGVTATDRILTMTSCNPEFSAAERIISYAVYVGWQPLSAGAPAEIANTVTSSAKG